VNRIVAQILTVVVSHGRIMSQADRIPKPGGVLLKCPLRSFRGSRHLRYPTQTTYSTEPTKALWYGWFYLGNLEQLRFVLFGTRS
jgi:hypothetical protein